MWFSITWSLFAGGMWKCLELQTRKALECHEQTLVEEVPGGSLEGQDAHRNVDCTGELKGFLFQYGHPGKCFPRLSLQDT